MAVTRHGHYIPGTPVDPADEGVPRARCGGINLCPLCSADCRKRVVDQDHVLQEISTNFAKFYEVMGQMAKSFAEINEHLKTIKSHLEKKD